MLKVGLVGELYKVTETSLIDYSFPQREELRLIGLKNSRVSFQLLLQSDEEFLLTTTANPVFDKRGPITILRTEVSLAGFEPQQYLVGIMEDDDSCLRADLLLHQETILVPAWRKQAVWVEVKLPEDAPCGEYKGRVRVYGHKMFADEILVEELSFTLQIRSVSLPKPSLRKFYLDLWQHCSNIARKHEVVLWSEEHFQILEGYVQSLAELGQKAVTVIASEIPWSGQRSFQDREADADLYEYSMVRIRKDKEGNFHYDFSAMDRYIQLCFKHGIDQEIEVFGLCNIWLGKEACFLANPDFLDDIRLRYLDEATGTYKFVQESDQVKAYIQALEAHFREKGLLDKVRVVADEPADSELYLERLAWLREAAPGFLYKAAINHIEMLELAPPKLVDFVPQFPFLCTYAQRLPQLREKIQGRFLYYVCCGPKRPNTFLCSPLAEARLIPILAAYMGLDGFLRWNYTVWPDRPREKIVYRPGSWPAGDTNFVYPAWSGKPILTLRYKALDRGIEDFELLQLVKEKCAAWQEIHEEYFKIILKEPKLELHHPEHNKEAYELYSLMEADYERARLLLIEALEKEV